MITRISVVVVSAALAISCHTRYAGNYDLPREVVGSFQAMRIADKLELVVAPYGFTRAANDRRFFQKWHGLPHQGRDLDGASARIDIIVDEEGIGIRDYTDFDETPFMQSVKKEIEKFLREEMGVMQPRFRRVWDNLSRFAPRLRQQAAHPLAQRRMSDPPVSMLTAARMLGQGLPQR